MATQQRTLSAEHKQAMGEGRVQGRIVDRYLAAIDTLKPRRGRQATPADLLARIQKLDVEIQAAQGSARLALVQQKMDLEDRMQRLGDNTAIDDLEAQFVKVAKPYAERKGFSPRAFREVGVPVEVLKKAGLA